MATTLKFIYGTEAQILALTPESEAWYNLGFYYPSDRAYFYQAVDGEMKKYGYTDPGDQVEGVTINDKFMTGLKYNLIEEDVLLIPENYLLKYPYIYNAGSINCSGILIVGDSSNQDLPIQYNAVTDTLLIDAKVVVNQQINIK